MQQITQFYQQNGRPIRTRLGYLLFRYAQPTHHIWRTFRPPALADAQRLGIYDTVAPLIIELGKAHCELLESYRLEPETELSMQRHNAALGVLEAILPDDVKPASSRNVNLRFDGTQHLYRGEELLGSIPGQARNLRQALNAFQKVDWPELIESPFVGGAHNDAIEGLNKNSHGLQRFNGLTFHSEHGNCIKLIREKRPVELP